ncbi:MAG: hypothetical protein CMJ31_03075 [Phycisphaerae bacterium]|nr:hypothetical protein [Phycisphaerae bacterium]
MRTPHLVAAATVLAPSIALAQFPQQPGEHVAAAFFADAGSQANGLADFETERSVGQYFRASRSGRLRSIEVVLSDQATRIPPELSRDIEVRVYAWNLATNTLGEQLGFRLIPQEDIPDGLEFSNYGVDEIEFASEGVDITINACDAYIVTFCLDEPFTNPMFGFPTILGRAAFAGPAYPEGESVIIEADGAIRFFATSSPVPPPFGVPGTLDFFFRVNVDSSGIDPDANADGSVDAFDVVRFLELTNAEDPLADINQDGAHTPTDARGFFALTGQGCQ